MAAVSGRTVLVTGATDGIGRATARRLLALGATVLLHGRDPRSLARLARELWKETGSDRLDVAVADLASIEEMRWLVEQVRRRHPELSVLVNNAGVFSDERVITADGLEQTFEVQYLAPFVLCTSLAELLRRNAPARVVNVMSALHRSGQLDFSNLQGERSYDGYQAYANTNLALLLFSVELAEQLRKSGVTVNCVHPGAVATRLLHAGFGPGGMSIEKGAEPVVFLASSSEVEGVTGRYFERQREARPDRRACDQLLRARLWVHTNRLVDRWQQWIGAPAP